MDVAIAGLAIVVLSPLLLLIAIAVRLDSRGPVIYRQERYGHDRRFTIFKFRSMSAEASQAGFRQATLGDQRVTRVGRILRRTNLDELPQLMNVLIGDMSLIGPRPHPIDLDDAFSQQIPQLMARYSVRPGITGWAQVNGLRGETPNVARMAARVQHDLEYIDRWSLWFDLMILWRTLHPRALDNAH